ncbi:glycosyltransferase family 87 protein [Arthrobacter monumenti]
MPTPGARGRRRIPARIVVPSRNDPLLRRFTELIGGPLGRRTAPGIVDPGFFTIERVLVLLTTLAAVVAVLAKSPCRAEGWTTPEHFYRACYSDWPVLFQSRGLGDGVFPYFSADALFEYPVLLGLIAGVTAWLVPGSEATAESAVVYFDINALFIAGAWIVTVLATARMSGRRPWDAAMVAVAPGIILAGTVNWDLWAVMLAALAMLAFARNQVALAGVLIGLGAATKLYPLLIFGAILVLAIRTGKYRPFFVSLGTAVAAWLAVNLPIALINFEGWSYFFTFSSGRPAGFSSPWFAYNVIAERLGLPALEAGVINISALVLFALACAGIAVLAVTAPRRPRMAQLVFLIVAAFILTNKVYSPQFVLWLVPLVALAHPRWRDFLLWQLAEALHFWAVWLYLAKDTSGGESRNNLDEPYYVMAIIVHMVAVGYLMAQVIHSMWRPQEDPVRRRDADDPQGGPFDQAPDRFSWRNPWRSPVRLAKLETTESSMHGHLDSAHRPEADRS